MSANNPFDVSDKVALVTGASRGIGKCIAKLLAAQGAKVIVSSRKLEGCEETVQEIQAAGGQAEAVACHIGDPDAIESMSQHLQSQYGTLDILVNNAAANPYFGPIVDTDLGAFQKTVDVNVRGYFFMSVMGAKLMAKNGGGSIINVASVNGVVPGEFQGIYSITKSAVIAMTKAFAKECAKDNVRVNALLPGATDTKFAATLVKNPVILEKALQHIPMNRIAEPDEMAGAVLYLASSAASYCTGSTLTVDGGYLLV